MAAPGNVHVRNQFVYILDSATLNVFDCINTTTGQRDIYYIQKGQIRGNVQFPDARHCRNLNQPSTWRPPPMPDSSSSSSDDEPTPLTSRRLPNTYSSDTYLDILGSNRTVTDTELRKLADKLRFESEKYTKLVTHLNVKNEDMVRIRDANSTKGKSEMIFQILKFWKANCAEPTVSKLGRGLEVIGLQKFITETLEP